VSRLVRAVSALYASHALTYFRSRTAIYWTLAFPLFFLFIFGTAFGRGGRASLQMLMPGLFTITLISSSFFGIAMRVVSERENGILRRHRVTPVPAVAIVLAHGAWALTTLLISLTVQALVAMALFHVEFKAVPLMVLVWIVGGLALVPIGLVAGSVARDTRTAPAITNFLFFPMMFLSGAAIPLFLMPDWMHRAAKLVPTTYAVESMQGVLVRGVGLADIAPALGVLLATSAVGIWLNAFLFRWESAEPVRWRRLLVALVALGVVYGVAYAFMPELHIAQRPVG
jgi:ABC-2 type transport system permease protein